MICLAELPRSTEEGPHYSKKGLRLPKKHKSLKPVLIPYFMSMVKIIPIEMDYIDAEL